MDFKFQLYFINFKQEREFTSNPFYKHNKT